MQNIDKNSWYQKSKERWLNTPANVKSVAGDFEGVHESDVEISCSLLQDLINKNRIRTHYAIDFGAGIGRVTQNVLLKYFSLVDLVERDEKYISYCEQNFANQRKVRNLYQTGLEAFYFENKYDVIWIQWCLEEVLDDDLVDFLLRCKDALSPNGIIVVKENILNDGREYWQGEHQKIRRDDLFRDIFAECGLKIEKHLHQKDNKKEIMDVSVFVLSAEEDNIVSL